MKVNKLYKLLVGIILILLIMFLLSNMPFLVEVLEVLIRLIFYPLVFGGLFYYILRPLIRFLDSKNINRNISVLFVFILIVIIIVSIGIYGGVSIKEQFAEFSEDVVNKFEQLENESKGILNNRFGSLITYDNIKERILSFSESGIRGAQKGTITFINKITNFVSVVLLIPIVLFFLLRDDKIFTKNLFKTFSFKHEKEIRIVLKDIDKTLSTYISGRIIVAIAIGIFTFIGYAIIKLPNALILAIITMIFSIIPMIGPILSIIPALIIAMGGGVSLIIKVLVVTFIVQQIEGNIITPKIIGDNLKIHPLTIIILVVVSITLLGFIGGLISIPLYAVIKVIIKDIKGFKA